MAWGHGVALAMLAGLLACSPKLNDDEKLYTDGAAGRSGILFGSALFEVHDVEKYVAGYDDEKIQFVVPMEFRLTQCGGIDVHAEVTDVMMFERELQAFERVKEGVYRGRTPGEYIAVGTCVDKFCSPTHIKLVSGDMACAIPWIEPRLHRVRSVSRAEIQSRP